MIRLKLDEILNDRGRSAYWVAQKTGLGNQTLWRLRHGKGKPSIATVNLLCGALNCQPGDLLEYVPDEPPAKIKDKRKTSKKSRVSK